MTNTLPLRRSSVTWQKLAASAGILFWLFLLYGHIFYIATPPGLRSLWAVLGPLTLTFDFLNPVFRSPRAFLISYVLGLGLLVWLFAQLAERPVWRLALIASGLVAMAFPVVMRSAYGDYELPVKAADGSHLRWITQPTNPFSSSFKRAQQIHEGECDYHLSGWSPEGVLRYTSACWPGVWRYDPTSQRVHWVLFSFGSPDSPTRVFARWDGYTYLTQPAQLLESGAPFLTLERAVSPDGKWEAVVVRRFYGPSDVVLLEQNVASP